MKRLVGALAASLALAGCGGLGDDGSPESVPADDPGEAMIDLIQHELAGRLGSCWALLVREQRAVVARALYVRCPNGQPISDAQIVVLGVRPSGAGRCRTARSRPTARACAPS